MLDIKDFIMVKQQMIFFKRKKLRYREDILDDLPLTKLKEMAKEKENKHLNL